MARVDDWLDAFLTRHRRRYRPGDWPGAGSEEMAEYADLWRSAFAREGVTEAEADVASKCCGEKPPNYRREHLQYVMLAVKIIRERRAAASAGEYMDREAARQASRDCEHCGGNGLATVWHPRPDPANRVPAMAAAYCTCSHGRWIKRNHAFSRECRHLVADFPDLADVLAGRSPWLAGPPGLAVRS